MSNNSFRMLLARYIIISLLFAGCTIAPSKDTVERVLVNHFEQRNYKVLKVVVGYIGEIPPGQKQYMGTAGYVVQVSSITVEFMKDTGKPWNYKKGQHMTFDNATVSLKKGRQGSKEWIITNIAGIPLP